MEAHNDATQQEFLLRNDRLRSSQYNLSIWYDKQKEILEYMRSEVKNKIWEAAVLVLLMGGIYDVRQWDGLRCHDTHTKFNKDWVRHSSNIKLIASAAWVAAMLVLLMGLRHAKFRDDR
jgi:hypothetical protein